MHSNYISKIISVPWNLDKLRARTILGSLVRGVLQNERPDESVFGEPLPKMQLVGSVALIPFTGVISINVPDWLKQYGFNLTDANDIEEEVEQALNDQNVKIIVFDVDSPGGLSIAGDKLFDVIESANRTKKCFAFCGDGCDMASTAYEAMAACTALLSGYYADGVGCIGSYLAYLDDTEFWAKMGFTWEVFKSGEMKGIGESVPLTPEQKAYLQAQVDKFGAIFRSNVKRYRTAIADEDMQGQWFDGKTAAQKGFVGACINDRDAAIAKFLTL